MLVIQVQPLNVNSCINETKSTGIKMNNNLMRYSSTQSWCSETIIHKKTVKGQSIND